MKAPTIEFPCDYPIKVVGHATETFVDDVLEVVSKHAEPLQKSAVSLRPSRQGNYQSASFSIRATGEAQLKALHTDLMARPFIKLVL